MVGRRLDELSRRYHLATDQRARLRRLLELLAQEETAPTTVREPQVAVDVHIADSLAGLEVEAIREARMIADLGSGAGLPALVLAIAQPEARVHAIESVRRKAEFIRGAAADLDLVNVSVVARRAEEWTDGMGRCDVVTARALASLPVLCEYAAPLLKLGGTLVAWKGGLETAERGDGRYAAQLLGLSEPQERAVRPYGASKHHRLVTATKESGTPSGYPRRPGVASKRPLKPPEDVSRETC